MLKHSHKKQPAARAAKNALKKTHKAKAPRRAHQVARRGFAINLTSSTTTTPVEEEGTKATDFKILPSAVKQLYGLNKLHLEQHAGTDDKSRLGIRITVDTGGCSGFQYIFTKETLSDPKVIDFITSSTTPYDPKNPPTADAPAPQALMINGEDVFFIQHQQFVVTDDISLPFLKQSEFEYKVELIRSGFGVVNNPNVELACGCGTSFSRKGSPSDV